MIPLYHLLSVMFNFLQLPWKIPSLELTCLSQGPNKSSPSAFGCYVFQISLSLYHFFLFWNHAFHVMKGLAQGLLLLSIHIRKLIPRGLRQFVPLPATRQSSSFPSSALIITDIHIITRFKNQFDR
jgi:hypothetical protein